MATPYEAHPGTWLLKKNTILGRNSIFPKHPFIREATPDLPDPFHHLLEHAIFADWGDVNVTNTPPWVTQKPLRSHRHLLPTM
jgi:hypothetical protein